MVLFVGAVWVILVMASLAMRGERALEAYPDPDDAMRLVEVRDLLNGQDWYDLTQHRLDPALTPAGGVPMHWSRLIDAPIAALIVAFKPLLGAERAEQAAFMLWPMIPALLLLPAAGFIGRRLAGRNGSVLAVLAAAFAAFTVSVYAPGRIDHHNIQVALGVALIAALMADARGLRAVALAGLFSGLTLAIGMETLPYVVLGGIVVALRWVLDAPTPSSAFLAYTGSFALVASLGLAVNAPPAEWLVAHCDVVSAVYLAPLWLSTGIAAAGAVLRVDRGRGGRLAIAALAAGAAVAAVALQNRACLAGPYAEVDPLLFTAWMNHLREARSAFDLFAANPVNFCAVFALPLAAAVAVALMGRGPARIAGLALAVAIVTALWQVRTLPFAATLASALVAAGVALAMRRTGATPAAQLIGGVVLSNPMLIALAATLAASLAVPLNDAQRTRQARTADVDCLRREDYRALAGLPPGLVLGNIAFGPLVLAETPHSVLAAPYHRNRAGILDAVAALTSPPEAAHAVVAQRGIAYIAICAGSAEFDVQMAARPGSLFEGLQAGRVPDWLERVPGSGHTLIFRVLR
jgi:hypothetical protein